jgi:hypothetical protein
MFDPVFYYLVNQGQTCIYEKYLLYVLPYILVGNESSVLETRWCLSYYVTIFEYITAEQFILEKNKVQ